MREYNPEASLAPMLVESEHNSTGSKGNTFHQIEAARLNMKSYIEYEDSYFS